MAVRLPCMPILRDVVAILDELYDPRRAHSWDAVGTVVGDPDADINRVLFAVDPVQAVADQAVAMEADLVVTHHPLWLKGVTSFAATTPKGRVAHTLVRHGIALQTCHTNADSPALGVSESMALALGVRDLKPLEADPAPALDSWVVYVPRAQADAVAAAMHGAGAGAIGDYDSAAFTSDGTGQFRPLDGAQPAIGTVGAVEQVDESRIEMVAERAIRERVRHAMIAAHPYEEVAHQVVEIAERPDERGSGRIGTLPTPLSLRDFADVVSRALPDHHSAHRIAGDLGRTVRRVAVCGGSGDFLLSEASNQGADVYVTSDLRHHPVSEHLEAGGCPVIDVPHWAAEWTWLPVAAEALRERLPGLQVDVSELITDPWSSHTPGTVSV